MSVGANARFGPTSEPTLERRFVGRKTAGQPGWNLRSNVRSERSVGTSLSPEPWSLSPETGALTPQPVSKSTLSRTRLYAAGVR